MTFSVLYQVVTKIELDLHNGDPHNVGSVVVVPGSLVKVTRDDVDFEFDLFDKDKGFLGRGSIPGQRFYDILGDGLIRPVPAVKKEIVRTSRFERILLTS
jgi:hypothetical protein